MKRKVFFICLLVLASFSAGWLLHTPARPIRPEKLSEALPERSVRKCVPAEPEEVVRYELAVQVLDVYGVDHPNSLSIGAEKFLAHGIYRRDGDRTVQVCSPEGLYHRVADIMAKHKMWRQGRQVEYDLTLAWRIGEARPEIIEAVAAVAFNEQPQESETFSNEDIRPFARTVLAGFGRQVASFGDTAFALISSENSLGTGAAQVAAAAGHPDALRKITSLMSELLSSIPENQAIPWSERNKLYELAYAISFAGEAGRNHLDPILELMKRKVQSWAPPFGMVELSPKRMCDVLRRISAEKPERIENYPYCLNDRQPYEQ